MSRFGKALFALCLSVCVAACVAPATPTSTEHSRPQPTPIAFKTRSAAGAPMVFVPAGPFHMGSTAEEIEVVRQECRICPQDWFDWEKVPHQVELPAYWIDQYEVTNRQYRRFIAAGGYDRRDL